GMTRTTSSIANFAAAPSSGGFQPNSESLYREAVPTAISLLMVPMDSETVRRRMLIGSLASGAGVNTGSCLVAHSAILSSRLLILAIPFGCFRLRAAGVGRSVAGAAAVAVRFLVPMVGPPGRG